jgi:DNA polymerase I-like protein with 3'-5' exonuclease and polymerase domains
MSPYVIPTIHPAAALRGTRPITDIIAADLAKGWRIANEGPSYYGTIITVLPSSSYGLEGSFKAAISWLDHWNATATWVAVDVETSSLDYFNCKLYSIALSGMDDHNTAVAFTLCDYHTIRPELETALTSRLATIMANPAVGKIYHNAPYDQAVLTRKGYSTAGKIYDTQGRAHLFQPDIPKDLGFVGQTYLDCRAWKVDHKGNKLAFTKDPDELLYYNGEDALNTQMLVRPQMKDLYTRGVSQELIEWQMRYADLATDIEVTGSPVDMELRRRMGMDMLKKMAKQKAWMRNFLNWGDFNPMSNTHRKEALFGAKYATDEHGLGIRPQQWTDPSDAHPHGQPSTSYKSPHIIEKLEHPFITRMVDYIETRHAYATQYREPHDLERWKLHELGLQEELKDFNKNPPKHEKGGAYERAMFEDGRLHVKVNPCGQKGARFSTSPNDQNRRYEDRIWSATKPGRILVGADKDQLELRFAACMAGVEQLLPEMQDRSGDPHTVAARAVYGEAFDNRNPQERKGLRKIVKNVVYASIYMAGVNTVWKTIREKKELKAIERAAMTLPVVSHIYHGYFGLYPEYGRYHEAKLAVVKRDGCLRCPPFNRPRYFPIYPPPFTELANWDIQTGGADVVTSEMCRIQDELKSRFKGTASIIGHYHDQYVIECNDGDADAIKEIGDRIFGNTRLDGPKGPVYLTAEASIGRNMKEVK